MTTYNLHLYPAEIVNESRIDRITQVIANKMLYDRVIIVGVYRPSLKVFEKLDDRRYIHRIVLVSKKTNLIKVIWFLEWNLRIFFSYINKNVESINSHSLSCLPIATLFKLIKKSRIVYDTHELETESLSLNNGFRKFVSKILEKTLVPFVNVVITVSPSITSWYKNQYKMTNIFTIRNMPSLVKQNGNEPVHLKEEYGISSKSILYIYQGNLHMGRGIKLLLDAFSTKTLSNKHILFMGSGDMVPMVKSYTEKYQNIHYHEAVPHTRLYAYTKSCDVGLAMIENTCLSYYYCLPNKLFEYVSAGLPVLVSNFPDMGKIVSEYKIGWCSNLELTELVEKINQIRIEELETIKLNVLKAQKILTWENEIPALENIYSQFISRST